MPCRLSLADLWDYVKRESDEQRTLLIEDPTIASQGMSLATTAAYKAASCYERGS